MGNSTEIRAYSRKERHACGITRKGQENSLRGHNCGFLPLIFQIKGN